MANLLCDRRLRGVAVSWIAPVAVAFALLASPSVLAEEVNSGPSGQSSAIADSFGQGERLDEAALKSISGLGTDPVAGSVEADGLKLSVILFDEVGRPKGGKAAPNNKGNSMVSRGINVRVGR